MKMNHLIIICIFFAIAIFLCNAADEAPIAKPFLQSQTQFLPSALEEPIAKPLEEPDVRKGRKKPPPPPRSPPPPPPPLTFDHFKLVQTWPATFCKIPGTTCIDSWPMKFLIHGLWPGIRDNDLKDCDKEKRMKPIYGEISTLKGKLDEYWPSLYKHRESQVIANKDLWFHEWNDHGTCSAQLFNFFGYLDVTIKLYNKNKIVDILQAKGIKHGGMFSRDLIVNTIASHIGFKPQIQCKTIEKVSYLLEVRLCFTASKDPQYTNCDGHGNLLGDCQSEVYF